MQLKGEVHIIGAGVSGLVAATELEKHGFSPVILEASGAPGGRVKTDMREGFALDHGFQVLLTNYPAARTYLDDGALNLRKFRPGAEIIYDDKKTWFGDPLRDFNDLLSALDTGAASIWDKWKVFLMTRRLKQTPVQEIFARPEQATIAYLQDQGFSERIIQRFFVPFFTGIFLDPELRTSSRMFEFVFKMFAEGHAAIPAEGMGAIAWQLAEKLERTQFFYNTPVDGIERNQIVLKDGKRISSNCILIATHPRDLLSGSTPSEIRWKQCQTLYFKSSDPAPAVPVISLVADPDRFVNTFFRLAPVRTQEKPASVLSATVVKPHQLERDALIETVSSELSTLSGSQDLAFMALYDVKKALPDLDDLRYAPDEDDIIISEGIFTCGDYLANGSLNAAMESGRVAAGVINRICTQT